MQDARYRCQELTTTLQSMDKTGVCSPTCCSPMTDCYCCLFCVLCTVLHAQSHTSGDCSSCC
jgi:hypothetical protein